MKLKKLFSSWQNGEGPKGTFGFDCTWRPKSRKSLRSLGNEKSAEATAAQVFQGQLTQDLQ